VVLLEHNTLCSHLNPQALEKLRRIAREQTFGAGQEIFREGDPGNGIYLVKDGLVEISVLGGQAGRYVFTEAGPGELLGEMAVIEDQPRSANAVARKETAVYFIPRKEILELVEECPALALAFLKEVSHRLRGFNRQYLARGAAGGTIGRWWAGLRARSCMTLKNPLNIIGLTAEMAALSGDASEAREKALRTIREQVDRINELVEKFSILRRARRPT
jgi:CRP-like cAMP-binding protein